MVRGITLTSSRTCAAPVLLTREGGGLPHVRPSCHACGMATLTDLERELLDFAGTWWHYAGAQEQAIRDRFDCSATTYWRKVNDLLDRPEALAYAPTTVKRLRARRERRKAARSLVF